MRINLFGWKITVTRKDVKPIEQAAAGTLAVGLLSELGRVNDKIEGSNIHPIAKQIADKALKDASRKIVEEFNKIANS